jgi:hypothetical protein
MIIPQIDDNDAEPADRHVLLRDLQLAGLGIASLQA